MGSNLSIAAGATRGFRNNATIQRPRRVSNIFLDFLKIQPISGLPAGKVRVVVHHYAFHFTKFHLVLSTDYRYWEI